MRMDTVSILKDEFSSVIEDFNASPAVRRVLEGRLSIAHYQSILREIYHYAKEDPQIQALAAVHFRGKDRQFVKMFFKHATMEIGHDRMALDDLAALGVDVSSIPASNPLPATVALISFPFYQISYLNPVGYLGYLYFLEFMPTQEGQTYGAALARLGVPEKAMSFLKEHVSVDVGHNKLMEQYLRGLVHDEADLEAVVYAMKVTAQLYSEMLAGAIRQAEDPRDYGIAAHEARRAGARAVGLPAERADAVR
jgi:pyrroloquinoline quinone (PQQ) biosynthesis protein C